MARLCRAVIGSVADATLAQIATLAEPARTRAYWLVWACRTAGYPVVIHPLGARRTLWEQRELVAAGRSKTNRSKHPLGLAFDIDWLGTSRDAVPQWFWQLVGPWAERELKLRWGGRWSNPYDPGHFEV